MSLSPKIHVPDRRSPKPPIFGALKKPAEPLTLSGTPASPLER